MQKHVASINLSTWWTNMLGELVCVLRGVICYMDCISLVIKWHPVFLCIAKNKLESTDTEKNKKTMNSHNLI